MVICMAMWVHRDISCYMVTRLYGYKLHGYMVQYFIRLYARRVAWLHGYMVTWLYGYMVIWLHACMDVIG